MLVVRAVREEDLDQLFELIQSTSYGLTTLKISREQLHDRIELSLFAFGRKSKSLAGHPYVFVMEEVETNRIVGTASIYSKVGGYEPFYSYRITPTRLRSQMLGVDRTIEELHLVKEHNGPTEIGSLFLSPEFRGSGNGRLLSLSRFLFLAQFPDRFDTEVIAEMRGVVNEEGHSPFWDAIGAHFFGIDFPKAEILTSISKNFIADLMPQHPIYVMLLSEAAQRVIGKVHPQTEPAIALLMSEGFRKRDLIDIFDGGPVVHVKKEEIGLVKRSREAVVHSIASKLDGPDFLISNVTEKSFRCALGKVKIDELESNLVVLEEQIANALQVSKGSVVRIGTLKTSTHS